MPYEIKTSLPTAGWGNVLMNLQEGKKGRGASYDRQCNLCKWISRHGEGFSS